MTRSRRVGPERQTDGRRADHAGAPPARAAPSPIEALAHVRHAGGQPDPDAGRNRDHRRSRTSRTRPSASGSTLASTTTLLPRPSTISIRPAPGLGDETGIVAGALAVSGTTTAGMKPATGSSRRSGRNSRRHRVSSEREIPCRRAVADTRRGPARLSSTTRSFSSSDQRRRRSISTTSSREAGTLSLWTSISAV